MGNKPKSDIYQLFKMDTRPGVPKGMYTCMCPANLGTKKAAGTLNPKPADRKVNKNKKSAPPPAKPAKRPRKTIKDYMVQKDATSNSDDDSTDKDENEVEEGDTTLEPLPSDGDAESDDDCQLLTQVPAGNSNVSEKPPTILCGMIVNCVETLRKSSGYVPQFFF